MQEQPPLHQESELVPEQIVLSQLLAVITIDGSDHTRVLLALDSSGILLSLPLPNELSAEKYLEQSLQTGAISIPIQSDAYSQYHLMQVDGNNRLSHIDFSGYSKLNFAEVRVQEPMEYHDSLTESDSISIPVLERGVPKSYYFTDRALCQGLQDAQTVSTNKETVLLVPIKGDKTTGKAWILTVALNTEQSGALGRSGAAGELFLGKFIDVLYHDKEPKLGGKRQPYLKRLIEYCEITPEEFVDEIIKQAEAALAELIEPKKGFSLIAARLDVARLSNKLRNSLTKQIASTEGVLDVTTKTGALDAEELLNLSNAKLEYRGVIEPLLNFKQFDILLYGLIHEALLEETGTYYRPAEILSELNTLGGYLLTGNVEDFPESVIQDDKVTLADPHPPAQNDQKILTPLELKQKRSPILVGHRDEKKQSPFKSDDAPAHSETLQQTTVGEVGVPLSLFLEKSQHPPQQFAALTAREPDLVGQNAVAIEGHTFSGNDITVYLVTHRPSRYESTTTYSVSIQSPRTSEHYVQRLDAILTQAFRNGAPVFDEKPSYPGIILTPGEIVRFQNQLGQYIEFTLTYTANSVEIVGSNLFVPPIIPEDSRILSDAQNISVLSYPVSPRARLSPSAELRNLIGTTRKSNWSMVGQIEETIYYHHTEISLSLPRTSSYTYYLATNFSNDLSLPLSANELLNTRKSLVAGDMVVAYSRVTDTSEYLVYTKAGLLVSFKRKGRPETQTSVSQLRGKVKDSSTNEPTQLKKQSGSDLGTNLSNQYFASRLNEFSHRLQSYVFDEMTVFPDEKGGVTVYDGPALGISLQHSEHPHRVKLFVETLSITNEPLPSISINGRVIARKNQDDSSSGLTEPTELTIWDTLLIQQQNGSQTTLILTPEKTLQVVQNRKQRESRVDVVQSFDHPANAQVVGYLGSPLRQPNLEKPHQILEKILYWPNIAYIHSTIMSNNQQIDASVTSIDPKRFLLFYASQSKGDITQVEPKYYGSFIPKFFRNDQIVAFDVFSGNSYLLTVDESGLLLSSEMPKQSASVLKELVVDIAQFESRKELEDTSDSPVIIKTRKPNSKIKTGKWNTYSHSEVHLPFPYGGPPLTLKPKRTNALNHTVVFEVLPTDDPQYHNFVIKKNGRPTMSSELEVQPGDVFSCYDPETNTESVFLYTFNKTVELIRSNATLSSTSEYEDGRISFLLPKNYEIIGHLGDASENISFIQAGYHQKRIPWLQLGSITISISPTTATLTTNSSYQYYETDRSNFGVSGGSRQPISIAGSLLSLTHSSHIVATTPFSPFEYHLQVLQSGFIVTYTKARTDL